MAKDANKRKGPGKRRARKHGTPIYGLRYTDRNGIELYWAPTLGRYVTVPEDDEKTPVAEIPRVIGVETTYVGNEVRFGGHGARVKITGVLCRGRHIGVAPEDRQAGYLYVTDDIRLAQLGGIQPGDSVEVHYWLPEEGQWGFVGHEIPEVSDLAIFADLKPTKKAKK